MRLCRAFPNYLPEERRCCQTETEEGARERDGRQREDGKKDGMLTATGRENCMKTKKLKQNQVETGGSVSVCRHGCADRTPS